MNTSIRIENLSKQYRLGSGSDAYYRTLRESLTNALSYPVRRLRKTNTAKRDNSSFWALKDVSLDVKRGEVVGIIGRNGAGKSTLLKILSNITEPTRGRIEYAGRIGSLLEVGTGFHPELSGRENIYLNGSVLGMRRTEIDRKFDEIVAFSEIDKFLDTPVKRYSSGMYVRLAFAVASTLEPEILVVDEVLAVGDQAFQRKCLGKMSEISQSKRTVLFVSHNMAAIQSLCEKVLVLSHGRVDYFGPCEKGIERYMREGTDRDEAEIDLSTSRRACHSTAPVFRHIRLLSDDGIASNQFSCGQSMLVELELDWKLPPARVNFGIAFNDSFGRRLFTAATFLGTSGSIDMPGVRKLTCRVPSLQLAPGRFSVDLFAIPIYYSAIDEIHGAAWFDVLPSDYYGNGRLPTSEYGSYLTQSIWTALPQ